MAPTIPASDAVGVVAGRFAGHHGSICGGAMLAALTGREYSDVDLFAHSEQAFYRILQSGIEQGFAFSRRSERTLQRWTKGGFKGWATNSFRFDSPEGIEVNLVLKLVNNRALDSGSAVIHSFDHGQLAVFIDLEEPKQIYDYRRAMFPSLPPGDEDYPMMRERMRTWEEGWVSKYNGPRAGYRWAVYACRGYPMTRVAQSLVKGYDIAIDFYIEGGSDDDMDRAQLYTAIRDAILDGKPEEIIAMYESVPLDSTYDEIMRSLND